MAKNLDMFSLLHESLHLFIISLLPYKEAARTSILSKRWLEAWRDSTKIDVEFNELFFVKPDESDESKEAKRRDFLNFITDWISRNRNQFVDKFSLKVSNPESCREIIESCVAFATQRGVKELSLDFSDPNWIENSLDVHNEALVQLPQHVYELRSLLESLKLYSCGFNMPHMINFQSIKDISLGWIEISEMTLRTLLYTSKTLQNLSLKKCGKFESFDMGMIELGLKRLVFDKCDFDEFSDIYFYAPNLEYFKYSGRVWNSYIIINHDVMKEAEIDFPSEFEPKFNNYIDEFYAILTAFNSVRVLTVCSVVLQTLHPWGEDDEMPHGLNVRHLILKTQMHPNELYGITFLLNSCRSLEKLTLEIGPRVIYDDYEPPNNIDHQNFWVRPMFPTPKCLTKTLKVVEIKSCSGTLNEINACKYLIGVGKVLEEMNINVMKDEQEEACRRVMAENLPRFPRASENLTISIA